MFSLSMLSNTAIDYTRWPFLSIDLLHTENMKLFNNKKKIFIPIIKNKIKTIKETFVFFEIFEICIYKYSKYISFISCNNFFNLIVML